jgi:hypothetical protein
MVMVKSWTWEFGWENLHIEMKTLPCMQECNRAPSIYRWESRLWVLTVCLFLIPQQCWVQNSFHRSCFESFVKHDRYQRFPFGICLEKERRPRFFKHEYWCLRTYTLLKKPSMTQNQNMWVTENSVIHIEGSEKSANNIDRAAQSMKLAEFPSPTCFGPASRLAFLTVHVQYKSNRWH